MIIFSRKITLLYIIFLHSFIYPMRPKDMSYHTTAIFSKEYYAKNFGTKLAPKLVALKQMQLNADIKGLEARRTELINILAKQWWDTTDLLTEKNQIDLLLQSPTTEAFSTIKNADLDTAVKTFNDIKNNLSEPELKAAQSILESRPDYASKSEINATKQKLNESKNTSSHNTQVQNNATNTQKTNNHIKPTYAFDNIVDFENETMKLHKINIQDNSTCASSITTNNSEKPSYNSAHYNYAYANTPPSSHVNTNDSYNTHDVCDNKMYASGYDKFTPTPMATFVAAKIQSTQGNDGNYNNKNKPDFNQPFNGNDQSSKKKNANNAVSSEFKRMQLNGDKKGLIAKKKELKTALKNAWFFTSSIKAQIAEIDIILKSPITETLSIIRDADFYTACITFYSFERSILGISEEGVFNMKAYDLEESEQQALNAAREIFHSRSEYQPPYSPTYGDIGAQVTNQSKVQNNNSNTSTKDSLTQKPINKSTAVDNQKVTLDNEQNITHIDSFDMVSTTISQDAITITPEANQRIAETLNTLNDNSLETISSHIKTLVAMLNEQKLDAQTNGKYFTVGLESCALLQKYIENPTKQIVAQQDKNTLVFNARKDALESVAHNPTECYAQSYELTPKAHAALQLCGIDPEQFTYCFGNEAQQQLNYEFVDILNKMVETESNISTQPLFDLVITCTHVGNAYAQENNLDKAFSLADCAWAALDCAKMVCDSGIDIAKQRIPEIAEGMLEGCINAVYNTAHMITHPRETIRNIRQSFAHLGECLVKLALSVPDPENQFISPEIDEIKAELRQEIMENIIAATSQMTFKGTVSFATEQLVSGKIFCFGMSCVRHYADPSLAQLGKIVKGLKDKAVDKAPKAFSAVRQKITDQLGNFTKAEHVAVTAEGIEVTVSNAQKEANALHNAMDVEWAQYKFKHAPQKNMPWKEVVKSTKHGVAKYKQGINIKEFELHAWKHGQKTTNGKNWKVFKADDIIGANSGKETCYVRVECSGNSIHGHPILESEYLRYLK